MAKQPKKANLGCGPGPIPEDWINVDGSWNARLAKYPIMRRVLRAFHILPASLIDMPWSQDVLVHDLRKPLPFQIDSLYAIYSSHTLEHLYLEEAKRLLKEYYRVLRPSGVLRIVVPDLQAIVLEYMGEKSIGDSANEIDGMSRADRLNYRFLLRSPEPQAVNIFHRLYTAMTDFHSHKWMYDAESLIMYFKWTGFVDVQEMKFHQSRIEGIEEVEQAGRVLNGAGICIEGVKPDAH